MATPKTVAFHTLGCKLNFSETSTLAQQFKGRGYGVVELDEGPDIFVLNTCSVTDFADRKCRKAVRQVLRNNPDTKVVVTGCYAQLKPQEIAGIPGVDLVLGAGEKFRVVDYVERLGESPESAWVEAGQIDDVNTFNASYSIGDRTRSFLKVQDGCDYKCSFCTIPQARGKSRSSTIESIVESAETLGARGIREIVLTGVNIGDFRDGNERFVDVVRALDHVKSVARFRISSIEPNLCSDEVIDAVATSERFMPHFHMPLQSGNDKQLRLMRRRYKRELYSDRVRRIKSKMPHACIGVDVIVGFPGESDGDFQESFDFIHGLDVSYLHVFTYSERANTPAADMEDVVPMEIRRERNARLRALSVKKRNAFYHAYRGTNQTVLTEAARKEGFLFGYTENYIKVKLNADEIPSNTIIKAQIGEYDAHSKAMTGQPAGIIAMSPHPAS